MIRSLKKPAEHVFADDSFLGEGGRCQYDPCLDADVTDQKNFLFGEHGLVFATHDLKS